MTSKKWIDVKDNVIKRLSHWSKCYFSHCLFEGKSEFLTFLFTQIFTQFLFILTEERNATLTVPPINIYYTISWSLLLLQKKNIFKAEQPSFAPYYSDLTCSDSLIVINFATYVDWLCSDMIHFFTKVATDRLIAFSVNHRPLSLVV